jgi:hypothetical protein
MRSTYTYVTLEVSESAYNEIATKLKNAGYDHVFHKEGSRVLIDMHGLALDVEPSIVKEVREHIIQR